MQAKDSMCVLRNSLIRHFGTNRTESKCPIGYAVVFPNVACPPISLVFERVDVIDLDDLKRPISKSIMRVAPRRLRSFRVDKSSPRPNTN